MLSIRVSFTVTDLQNLSEQQDFDDALSDEVDYTTGDHSNHAVNQSQASQSNVSPQAEDRAASADREFDEDLEDPSFPARVNVTIEKPGSGSLLIQTVAQDGVFEIEQVSYFAKPDLVHAETAEKDWARQSLYAGPPFENLDEDLQGYIERYLEERGLNAELANTILDYIQVKEQKEYVRWLKSKFLHLR
jgi:complement component 1 Q subcomponent-binding protein, mitochondrial